MATINAVYKRYNGTSFDIIHFQTNVGQVGEISTVRFLKPSVHLVNGKSFYDNGDKSITLYAGDIKLSSTDDTTIKAFLDAFPTSSNMVTSSGNLGSGNIPVGNGSKGLTDGGVSLTSLVAIANGKTKSFVVSYADTDSSEFNSNNATITVAPTDTIRLSGESSSVTYSSLNLKVGDIILVVETDVPDRWVSAVDTANNTITLSKMETAHIDLTNYQTKGTTLSHYGITDAVSLDTSQSISGAKTFNNTLTVYPSSLNYPLYKVQVEPNAATLFKYWATAHDIYETFIDGHQIVARYNYGINGEGNNLVSTLTLPLGKNGTIALLSDIRSVPKVYYGTTQPSDAIAGDYWIDSTVVTQGDSF